jgi:AraC family transcriptional regulator
MIDVALKPVETLVFRSSLALLAEYHCGPESPWFANSGPSNAHAIVFPHTSTRIRAGGDPFIETPMAVSFFNRGDEYSSELLSAEGSHCSWLTLDSDLLREIAGVRRGDRVFPLTQTQAGARITLRQRTLFAAARREVPDLLAIEEEAIAIAANVIRSAWEAPRVGRTIGRVIEMLAATFDQTLSLADVAREARVSPAYLSRAFHQTVGKTMHAFREELRLRRALDLLPQCRGDLSRLALDLGYSSHSHFSSRFRKLFHKTPREFMVSTTSRAAWRDSPALPESRRSVSAPSPKARTIC